MLTPKSGPGVNFCCVAVLEEARSFSVGGGYVLDGRMMTTLGVRRSVVVVGLIAFLLVVLAALLATGCGNSGDLPSAGGSGSDGKKVGLSGAGATFPEPLYLEWIGEFMQIDTGTEINYQGIGSGGGIQQFTLGTVDFGATDAPMTDQEIQAAEEKSGAHVLHIPTVLGAVVVVYNLGDTQGLKLDPEVLSGIFLGEITNWQDPKIIALNESANLPDRQIQVCNLGDTQGLKLDPEVLSGIFLGEITNWQDPKIIALNESANLPDRQIQVAHRSDSSGTTSIFTGYLSAVSETWQAEVGSGKDVRWPVGIGGQGNDGSAAVIQQQEGSIGYVEFSYAQETGLPTMSLKNADGEFVSPSLESTAAAGVGARIPEDLRFSLSNSQTAGAYPIVGATWILAYDSMEDQGKAEALKGFLRWAIEKGDARAKELQYAPIAGSLEEKALAKIDAIGSS